MILLTDIHTTSQLEFQFNLAVNQPMMDQDIKLRQQCSLAIMCWNLQRPNGNRLGWDRR